MSDPVSSQNHRVHFRESRLFRAPGAVMNHFPKDQSDGRPANHQKTAPLGPRGSGPPSRPQDLCPWPVTQLSRRRRSGAGHGGQGLYRL